MSKYTKINEKDNVVVALEAISRGGEICIENTKIQPSSDVDKAHKIAIEIIKMGEKIIKYGEVIGTATSDINIGDHVHTHNVVTTLSDIDKYTYEPDFNKVIERYANETIMAYPRKNGDIGIRNELWIVPTVGCVNAMAKLMKREFLKNNSEFKEEEIHVFTHDYGCSQMGEDHQNTRVALQNIAKHPNAGGVLVVGLGCENNQVGTFKETMGEYDEERIAFLISQDVDDEVKEGVILLSDLYGKMKLEKRVETPISKLKIGLECGGSDGLSGITANPLLGKFSDFLVVNGGTSVLTEVPEMFGAEHILMKRSENEKVFSDTVDLINEFKNYYKSYNQVIYDNPSPGNKKGGITTLEEKSIGCIQKAGDSNVMDVLKYGELIKTKGVNLVSAPGNDLVATTALGISGCHLVVFTTGRGTPYGGFIPTIKVSTNSEIANKKPHWIDFNAGKLIEGIEMKKLVEEFISYVCSVCSGEITNNEKNDFREIAIFKNGVTL